MIIKIFYVIFIIIWYGLLLLGLCIQNAKFSYRMISMASINIKYIWLKKIQFDGILYFIMQTLYFKQYL